MTDTIPAGVLSAWPALEGGKATSIAIGNINPTYKVEAKGKSAIVQQVHPIFDATVHYDIAALTSHLSDRRFPSPRLMKTKLSQFFVRVEGNVWRAQTLMEGVTHEKIESAQMAREAGRLVGTFHRALADFDHAYTFTRANVHNTDAHIKSLEKALEKKEDHRLHDAVRQASESVLAKKELLSTIYGAVSEMDKRHCHGDLKISNILFHENGRAHCLVDLDTIGSMPWAVEMGDALRSWCNPGTEDEMPAKVNLEYFQAALEGYAPSMKSNLTQPEIQALVDTMWLVCSELSIRFFADALNEDYFGFDEKKYKTAGEANLARGKAMSSLADDVQAQKSTLSDIVNKTFG